MRLGMPHFSSQVLGHADPLTIQEGRRAIAQAILDNRVKARGPRCPRVSLPAQQPFKFNTPRTSRPRGVSIHYSSDNG